MAEDRHGADPSDALLRVLGTTDLHTHLIPYDYHADRPSRHGSLAHLAARIMELRTGTPATLLLDNGDWLQGTPLSDLMAEPGVLGALEPHPAIAAMNALDYDAGTLGNHEFNYGLDYLERVLRDAAFPWVSANIRRTGGAAFLPPWTILRRRLRRADGRAAEIRIGVIGFAPPQLVTWDRQHLAGRIETLDILAAAETELRRMRAAGADLIIALSHSGIGAEAARRGMENAAVPLAALPGIDALLLGHTHGVFPGPNVAATAAVDPVAGTLHGRPAVMAGCNGSHLAVIDLRLRQTGSGWTVIGHAARAEPVPGGEAAPQAPAIVKATRSAHARTLKRIREPIGSTTGSLQSYFSLAAPDAALQLMADAQRAAATAALAGTPAAALPLLSAVAPFKCGGGAEPGQYVDIPPGPLALRHAAEIFLYPNALCVVEVTGALLIDWLERSAGIFRQVAPGARTAALIDPRQASYNFDVIDGLTYRIDLARRPRFDPEGEEIDARARRVGDLCHDGRALRAADRFAVATNSYRAAGGGGFRAAASGRVLYEGQRLNRDLLADFIRTNSPITPKARESWRFAPMPGTTLLYDTGPGAHAHIPPGIRHAGPAGSGLERFEIPL